MGREPEKYTSGIAEAGVNTGMVSFFFFMKALDLA